MIPLVRSIDMSADPRCQPLAYVSDGVRLCEVIGPKGVLTLIEDCRTGERFQVTGEKMRSGWVLVRAAPSGEFDEAA